MQAVLERVRVVATGAAVHHVLILGGASFLAASCARTQPAADRPAISGRAIAAFLTTGTVTVDVMEFSTPPRFAELTAKLRAAAQSDPAWFMAHAKAAQPGEPLPYDARLGMTEAEWREFLALTSDSMRIRPAGRAELRVISSPSGWRLLGGTGLPELDGIEIDTVAGEVRTPLGSTTSMEWITPKPEQKVTGPFEGIQWKREDPSIEETGSGTAINFTLGRLVESGRMLLYYDAKRIAGGVLTARAMRIVGFDTTR